MTILAEEIKLLIAETPSSAHVASRFTEKLLEDGLTRDENPKSHFCAYFLPYNKEAKRIFIVHHKKSGLWLSPGGHIDNGETLMTTLNREINEELGIKNKLRERIKPFLLTITPIDNQIQPCKEHLDIWYRIPMAESEINADTEEFHASRWVTISETKKLVVDPATLEALEKIEKLFISS